jgi:hypothetical protein
MTPSFLRRCSGPAVEGAHAAAVVVSVSLMTVTNAGYGM